MALFGFVYGYVGTAGAPFCGSLGQCVQRVVDAGPPWFYPASLVPGAFAAAVFAAFVYVLFLLVSGLRAAFRRSSAANTGQEPPAQRQLRAEPPAARLMQEPPAPPRRTEPPAVQTGPRRWSRPTPLVIAIGIALAWAVLSVGPGRLVDDLGRLIPKEVTALPMCTTDQAPGTACRRAEWWNGGGLSGYVAPGQGPTCGDLEIPETNHVVPGVVEADGLCHGRWDGTVDHLMDDIVSGGQSGLLAFLAVGAALLLWPRLRAAGKPTG